MDFLKQSNPRRADVAGESMSSPRVPPPENAIFALALSERARSLLARYKTVESLSPAHKERLLARLQDAVARGTSPRLHDDE
jgi:hypothetical protein